MNQGNPDPETAQRIQVCQRFLRLMTGVILGAFALIILMTTVSTGPLVQTTGKLLYYLIALAALCSLGVWLYRIRIERLSGKVPDGK